MNAKRDLVVSLAIRLVGLAIQVVLLVLMVSLIAGGRGYVVTTPAEHEGITWPVERGWLRQQLWPTAVEPVEPAVGIMNPPHWICPDPKEC